MSIQLTVPPKRDLKPRIVVFGVGGAGGNAVNNMIAADLEGVDFVAANTDAQALSTSGTERRIQMGNKITEGLGAGSDPEVGRQAAEEAIEEIKDMLQGSHMAFVTAGMGGGTGTGAAPVIARAARDQGILTVGVVTKPFDFEGSRRMRAADDGITALSEEVDTLIIIPNQNLFRMATANTTFAEAFAMADEVLHSGVSGITDLMIKPGLINLDFADVRAVMNEMGKAMMGTGEADGDDRALIAADAAIANPLLDDVSMRGARGVLINISGGADMTLYEVDAAANRIKEQVDSDANIIIGSAFDDTLKGLMRVSVVATGIDVDQRAQVSPVDDSAQVISMHSVTDIKPDVFAHQATTSDSLVDDNSSDMSVDVGSVMPPVSDGDDSVSQSEGSALDDVSSDVSDSSSDNELPDFLRNKAVIPACQDIPKRQQSFIKRILGNKSDDIGVDVDDVDSEVSASDSVSSDDSGVDLVADTSLRDDVVQSSSDTVLPSDDQEVAMFDDIAVAAESHDEVVLDDCVSSSAVEMPVLDTSSSDVQTSSPLTVSESPESLDIPSFLRR